MLRCNLTKSDESTFFILNVDWVFVRNWVLRYINENAKRSAESILELYIHFLLSSGVEATVYYCEKPICMRCNVTQLARESVGLGPPSWFVREGIRVITQ